MYTGTDIVEHKRFFHLINRKDGRLKDRLFTEEELSENTSDLDLAIIFSAKESISKALGSGFTSNLSWQDINILLTEKSLSAVLRGKAQELAGDRDLHLTSSSQGNRTVTCALFTERG